MLCTMWYCVAETRAHHHHHQNPFLISAALLACCCYGYCTVAFLTELQPSNSRSWHCTPNHDLQTGYFLNTCSSLQYQQFCLLMYLERWGCVLPDTISLWTVPMFASKVSTNHLHIGMLVIFFVSSNHAIWILKEWKLRSLYRMQCKPVSVWFKARHDTWQNE